jgi:hypothetical protein
MWSPNTAIARVDAYISTLGIPEITISVDVDSIDLPDLSNAANDDLASMMSNFGGWRSYLEAKVSEAEAKKSVFESGIEEALAKAMAVIARRYQAEGEKKPVKELLRVEAFDSNDSLKQAKIDLIEIEAVWIRLVGLRNQFKVYQETISRVIALRTAFREDRPE